MKLSDELRKIANQLERRKSGAKNLNWGTPINDPDALYNAGWSHSSWEDKAPELLQETKLQGELAKFGLEVVIANVDEEGAYWQIAKKGETFEKPF